MEATDQAATTEAATTKTASWKTASRETATRAWRGASRRGWTRLVSARGPADAAGLAVLVVAALLAGGCTTYRTPWQVETLVESTLRDAEARLAAGDSVAARRLVRGVERVWPDAPGTARILAAVPLEVDARFRHPLLGSNVATRQPVERSFLARAVRWLPDRLLDLADVLSFGVGVGPGLLADVHLTRHAQLVGGARGSIGLGWHGQRVLGVRVEQQGGWAVPFASELLVAGSDSGLSGRRIGSGRLRGAHRPGDPLYQDWRDFWAVGAGVHLAVVGFSVDLHPVQLADALAGWLGADPLGDDGATSESRPLGRAEAARLAALHEVRLDDETRADFERWIAFGERMAEP